MAARISHKSRRSSASRWRRMLTFITGMAAPIRISRMVMTAIISIRVTPRCRSITARRRQMPQPELAFRFMLSCPGLNFISALPLVYRDRGLRAQHVLLLVLAVTRARNRDGNHTCPLGLGDERKVKDRAVAGNTWHSRRPLRGDLELAGGSIVAMHQDDVLAVFSQEIAIGDAHELEHTLVIADLDGNGRDVLPMGENNRQRECAALLLLQCAGFNAQSNLARFQILLNRRCALLLRRLLRRLLLRLCRICGLASRRYRRRTRRLLRRRGGCDGSGRNSGLAGHP